MNIKLDNGKVVNLETIYDTINKNPLTEKKGDFLSSLFPKSKVDKAIKIAKKMSGNMTGAVKAIEKFFPGMSRHNDVQDALRKYNESIDESAFGLILRNLAKHAAKKKMYDKLKKNQRKGRRESISVNEDVYAIVDKFDDKKQDYDQVYFKDNDLNKVKKHMKKMGSKYGKMNLIKVKTNGKMSLVERFRPSDRKVLLVIGRDVVKILNDKYHKGTLRPSKQLGQALNSIFRAMTRDENDANYKQYKKYFPKYNAKLLRRLAKAYFDEPVNVQNTFINHVMKYALGD